MTAKINSDFCVESGTNTTLTDAIRIARARIRALTSGQIVRPESFGAVANNASLAVASNNCLALQNWMASGADGGLLLHDPANVYYVQARPTSGPNASQPITITNRVHLLFLRVKTKSNLSGADSKLFDFSYRSKAVYDLSNAPITRGQRSWFVPIGSAVEIGQDVLISAGQDPYDGSLTNALYLRAKVIYTDPSTGLVFLDRWPDRSYPAVTTSPAPSLTIIASSADRSQIGYLEIDQSENGSIALNDPVTITGSSNMHIETLANKGVTDGGIWFRKGAAENRVSSYFAKNAPGQATLGDGTIRCWHDRGNRVISASFDLQQPANMVVRDHFSQSLDISSLKAVIHGPAGDWATRGKWMMYSKNECAAAHVNEISAVLTVNALNDGLDSGLRVAGNDVTSKPHQVGLLSCNLDFFHLGCAAGFVSTKSIYGPRFQIEKSIQIPSVSGAAAATYTTWLGRHHIDTLKYKFSRSLPRADCTLFIHSNTFNAAGSQTDELMVNFGQSSIPQNKPSYPANTWVEWLDLKHPTSPGDVKQFNSALSGTDKYFRVDADANSPAQKIQFSYSGYPLRATFVQGNAT